LSTEPRENKEGREGREGRQPRESREQREAREREAREMDPFQDAVVHIARVAKVVKGGRRFSFSALVVVGDGKERVGFGLGKASEVPDAIRKASEQAKKRLVRVSRFENTIPFEVVGRYGSARVLMFPAPRGVGIIAGGAVRTLVELAGIKDVVCKVHGTKNHQNVVRAVMNGFSQMMSIEDYAKGRDTTVENILANARHKKSDKPGETIE
jgi:small subunit ribosomal protein S5